MPVLQKLNPQQDLQCYFYEPSAIAALSQTTPSGFTVSGSWRQQADWAVVEWNRDNVFEHPLFRNLPDGDLSGLCLSYQETRSNCIPIDSNLYATVDWPYLRVWADPGTGERVYRIPLLEHATPIEGTYTPASATFTLGGTACGGDYIEFAWDEEHYTYQLYGLDTLTSAAANLADSINRYSHTIQACARGTTITLTLTDPSTGNNGNRTGVYANVYRESGRATETWTPEWTVMSGGTSPSAWQIDLDFSTIYGLDMDGKSVPVPMNNVRKLRWTWAADLQPSNFIRSDFSAVTSYWTVTGTNRNYQVAGPGSWRLQDGDHSITASGKWTSITGNYSGGSLSFSTEPGASVRYSYQAATNHTLYLGTRRLAGSAALSVEVDRNPAVVLDTSLAGEDVLVRWPLAEFDGGETTHTVTVTHCGSSGAPFYFDFFEVAVPAGTLPTIVADSQCTLATDWDTLHSQAIAPERTAWMIQSLGFTGRANHYAGALWFYELVCLGQQFAAGTITFAGTVEFGKITTLNLGPAAQPTIISHTNLIGDTPTSMAVAFALLINEGSTGLWASADAGILTLRARAMGTAGNGIPISIDLGGSTSLEVTVSGPLAGGIDGNWVTDLTTVPRMNRAARDWTQSFFVALNGYGIQPTGAFSMELGDGDPSLTAGIAQRYPDNSPCLVNTPALQTNFSPPSLAFWQQAYLDMADVMHAAGVQPYLQFGEVQWWYFCPPRNPTAGDWSPLPDGGMPFYDKYTTSTFQSQYQRAMHVFTDPSNDPSDYPDESSFLPGLIGQFTASIMAYVRQTYPDAEFEVLYPLDTNDAALTQVINLPSNWRADSLSCFKTENFTYTGDYNVVQATTAMELPFQLGFTAKSAAHLVGIGNYMTPWLKETRIAKGQKLASVVLFALDQCCLIGYAFPLPTSPGAGSYMGG